MKNFTFIGGGATGHGAAALFSSKGCNVTLFDTNKYASQLSKVQEKGNITLLGEMTGTYTIHKVTYDPQEAVTNADVIFINVVAKRHEEIARLIANYVKVGQHLLICPGNLGSFIFQRVFKEMGVPEGVYISELEGNIFPCRLVGDAEVKVGIPFGKKRIASLPSSNTTKIQEMLKGLVDTTANSNVFEGAINSTNFVMHLAATLLSSSAIHKRGDLFNMFEEGLTPDAVACSQKVEDEREAVIEKMGLVPHDNPIEFMTSLTKPEENPDLTVFRTLMGPNSTNHRYVTEDALCSGAFCYSLAQKFGVKSPVLESLLCIAGTLNNTDYFVNGRTLNNLGFSDDMTYSEIVNLI